MNPLFSDFAYLRPIITDDTDDLQNFSGVENPYKFDFELKSDENNKTR